jgi:hypothetical protein
LILKMNELLKLAEYGEATFVQMQECGFSCERGFHTRYRALLLQVPRRVGPR